jgi:hypothetical protein
MSKKQIRVRKRRHRQRPFRAHPGWVIAAISVVFGGPLLAYVVEQQILNNPTPFSLTCMQPDREVRANCHWQVGKIKTQMWLRELPTLGANLLLRYEDQIVADFEWALEAHNLTPEDVGVEPNQLRLMIQDKATMEFGERA